MSRELLTEKLPKWLEGIDTFLFDCDGVLWCGESAVARASEAIAFLRKLNKKVLFVTNNSTKSRNTYVQKLAKNNIQATVEEIITSASATAAYLSTQNIQGKLYVIGEAGLFEELEADGFECLGKEDGVKNDIPQPVQIDSSVQAVVIGLDRTISYYKIAYATVCLRRMAQCKFIATNSDATLPANGSLLPGAGSMLAALETASDRKPDATIGKPSQDLLTTIVEKYNLNASRTCMVGDRTTTDIEFGNKGGMQTLLVLTGVTSKEDLSEITNPDHKPDYFVDSIADLII